MVLIRHKYQKMHMYTETVLLKQDYKDIIDYSIHCQFYFNDSCKANIFFLNELIWLQNSIENKTIRILQR